MAPAKRSVAVPASPARRRAGPAPHAPAVCGPVVGTAELSDPIERSSDRPARQIAVKDPRIDVSATGHGRSVAEHLRHPAHGAVDRAATGALGGRAASVCRQRDRGEHGGVPGADVLGAELLAEHRLQVVADLLRAHVVPGSPGAIRQQMLTTAPTALERGDHFTGERIIDRLHPPDPALGQVIEDDSIAADRYVLLADRGQPQATVVIGVLLASDPEQTDVEILLAAGRVDSRRLQMPELIRADPDLLPRRWDRQPSRGAAGPDR
jgi:hypothetical protein